MPRSSWLGLLTIAALATLGTGQPASLQVHLGSVDVSRFPSVLFSAAVLDWTGIPVADLDSTAFEVLEDGKPVGAEVQAVEDENSELAVVLAIDTSGSMRGQPLRDAMHAAGAFIAGLGPADRVGAISFGHPDCSVAVTHPLSLDKSGARASLEPLVAGGNTPLFNAAVEGLSLVSGLPPGRKSLVLLTDAEDTCSRFTADDVIAIATRDRVPVFIIGLGPSLRPAVLRRISDVTGGHYLPAASSGELADIYRALARQLRTRYAIRYESGVLADRKEHALEVRVHLAGSVGRAEQRFTPPAFAPTVRLNLAEGTTLQGPVELLPELTAPVKLAKVEYLLDNVLLHTATEAPFGYVLDPTGLGSGRHVVRLRIADAFGGTSELEVPVEVAGGPPAWLFFGVVLVLPVLALGAVFVIGGRQRARRCPECGRRLKKNWSVCPVHGQPALAAATAGSKNVPPH